MMSLYLIKTNLLDENLIFLLLFLKKKCFFQIILNKNRIYLFFYFLINDNKEIFFKYKHIFGGNYQKFKPYFEQFKEK